MIQNVDRIVRPSARELYSFVKGINGLRITFAITTKHTGNLIMTVCVSAYSKLILLVKGIVLLSLRGVGFMFDG